MPKKLFPSGISPRPLPAKLAADLTTLFNEIADAQFALAKQMTRATKIVQDQRDETKKA